MRSVLKLSIFSVTLALLGGCGTSPEEARQKLADLNIEYTEESFAEHAGRGDVQAVDLFLKAGMDPNHAMPAAFLNDRSQVIQTLEEAGAEPMISQARPFVAMLYALKNEDVKQFTTAFSEEKRREFGFQRPRAAKMVFYKAKKAFESLEVTSYSFEYDGNSSVGELTVKYPNSYTEKEDVIKEKSGWVLDSRP